jgi:hypothetical protein
MLESIARFMKKALDHPTPDADLIPEDHRSPEIAWAQAQAKRNEEAARKAKEEVETKIAEKEQERSSWLDKASALAARATDREGRLSALHLRSANGANVERDIAAIELEAEQDRRPTDVALTKLRAIDTDLSALRVEHQKATDTHQTAWDAFRAEEAWTEGQSLADEMNRRIDSFIVNFLAISTEAAAINQLGHRLRRHPPAARPIHGHQELLARAHGIRREIAARVKRDHAIVNDPVGIGNLLVQPLIGRREAMPEGIPGTVVRPAAEDWKQLA